MLLIRGDSDQECRVSMFLQYSQRRDRIVFTRRTRRDFRGGACTQ
jgi:hypothetical protein